MAHAHDHSHGEHKLEQICTLIISGLLGLICVLSYQRNGLGLLLASQFHIPVLLGGISLLALVALSAVMGLISPASGGHSHGCEGHDKCEHDHAGEKHDHEHACAKDHDHAHPHEHVHGATCDHDHDHAHTHEHAHTHASDDHGHDHGHDHGWNPWRYIVLLLPVVLYFLNMPNDGFSQSYMERSMHSGELDAATTLGRSVENLGMRVDKPAGQEYPTVVAVTEGGPADKAGVKLKDALVSITRTTDSDGKALAKPETIEFKTLPIDTIVADLGGKPQTKFSATLDRNAEKKTVELTRTADIIDLGFLELNDAALSTERREFYAGKIGRLRGQFIPSQDIPRGFNLARIRIRCCAADTTTLAILIFVDPNVPASTFENINPRDWVQVTGEIQFRKRKDRDEYATIMVVSKPDGVKKCDPDPEIYLTQ